MKYPTLAKGPIVSIALCLACLPDSSPPHAASGSNAAEVESSEAQSALAETQPPDEDPEGDKSISEILRSAKPAPMPYPEDSTFDNAVEKEEEKESGRVVGLDPGAPDRAGEGWIADSPVALALADLYESLTIAALEADIDRILSLHTPDTILLPSGGSRIDGREEFQRYLEGVGGAGLRFLSLLTEPADVWQSGSLVVEIGTFRADLDDPEAKGVEIRTGDYVRVHSLQEDGTLKIRATMWDDH